MSKKIRKFLDVSIKAAEDGSGAFWFTASTETRDRQGDVIVQSAWRTQDFMNNPVILWAHNYYETPIGKALELKISEGALAAKIKFASDIDPFAAKVEKLVADGYLRTVSVGFMVYKSEALSADDLKQRPEMKYGQRLYGDLLEISVVPVPANPEALSENAFADVISRGFHLKADEARSKFLPYQDEKGNVNPRLLRASLAASLGARGGVKITDADPESCKNHLVRVAKENKIEIPNLGDLELYSKEKGSLREAFKDIWHEELLDVIHRAESQDQDVSHALIKGQTRDQIMATRDALNQILALSEEGPEPKPSADEPRPDVDTAAFVEQITKGLGQAAQILAGK